MAASKSQKGRKIGNKIKKPSAKRRKIERPELYRKARRGQAAEDQRDGVHARMRRVHLDRRPAGRTGKDGEAVRRHLFTLEFLCICAAIGALVALVLAEVLRG